MSAHIERREFAKGVIDRAIRKALDSLGRKPRRSFGQMVRDVQVRSGLLHPSRYVGRVDSEDLDRIMKGLLALHEYRKTWIRPIERWEPGGRTPIGAFSTLAHHLMTSYPVPPVLLSAWYLGSGWPARRRQNWFCHVGRGGSLRTAGFPIRLNRKMAHEFAHAPATFPIEFALRWAQVRSLGGSDSLARAFAGSLVVQDDDRADFWVSVIQFFVNHPKLAPEHVRPVVEFLHNQKFDPRPALIGEAGEDTEVDLDPPQPDLSLKGWSAASLVRRVEEWQATRRAEEAQKSERERTLIRWAHSAIGDFRHADEQGRTWTIRELLDSNELASEGRAMSHCVATYTAVCARRTSTIWSLGFEAEGGRERLATVEVNPSSREVVQASARFNEEPDEASRAILRRWAEQQELKVDLPEGEDGGCLDAGQ